MCIGEDIILLKTETHGISTSEQPMIYLVLPQSLENSDTQIAITN